MIYSPPQAEHQAISKPLEQSNQAAHHSRKVLPPDLPSTTCYQICDMLTVSCLHGAYPRSRPSTAVQHRARLVWKSRLRACNPLTDHTPQNAKVPWIRCCLQAFRSTQINNIVLDTQRCCAPQNTPFLISPALSVSVPLLDDANEDNHQAHPTYLWGVAEAVRLLLGRIETPLNETCGRPDAGLDHRSRQRC